ncbi:SigmaW regulon antibacterial [Bremerella volcania]|uniref:SigmaW regulon antibacterial n=1 Tax=Bremerella volcania TaxID=2527984 RepID=A0A518C6T0_9BACT|nr:flotillin-like FloA family protein [Bremerella volcania]QDU74927.1 SigmaW regulon antibacterial [Bremerella volcania]
MDAKSFIYGLVAGLLLAFILYMLSTFFSIFRPWLQVMLSGGKASVFQILGMRMRGSNVRLVTEAYVMLVQRGQKVSLSEVESQYIARKNVIVESQDLMQIVEQNLGSGTPG